MGAEGNDRVSSPASVPTNYNPIALREAKIVCNFGLSECNRVNTLLLMSQLSHDNAIKATAKPVTEKCSICKRFKSENNRTMTLF